MDMQIVYLVKDADIASSLRKRFIDAGLYGHRVTVRLIKTEKIP
jgi:hypothetical protein